MRKRIVMATLSFAAGCCIAAGCGLDEAGFFMAPDGSTAEPLADTGTTNPIADSGGDAREDASSSRDAGSCAACPPQTVCVANACDATRRVFLSSTQSNAALGGPNGADTTCQNLADAMKLGGIWRAWLSDQANSPAVRFTRATVPYRLLDGTLIANNWNDLTDGALDHGIDRDEKGIFVNEAEVWTGTTVSGAASGDHCSGFTTASRVGDPATVGLTSLLANWTSRYTQYCDRTNVRIYCFEQ
ncbi:DUF1554 domain-containing protein [Pendulispora rubella]|uniref:DUF1554 domain-containing protein n=1 Tax=Pendulispora rubella TaxID=2741070 RepID=A0ABZ2KWC6_9BACT